MDYYYKLISKQDITRSFVINRRAMDHFFRITMHAHGDESIISLKYNDDNFIHTRIILHQDCRLLIKERQFEKGQIAFFQRLEHNKFTLMIIKDDRSIKLIKQKLHRNFYLSNTLIKLYAD